MARPVPFSNDVDAVSDSVVDNYPTPSSGLEGRTPHSASVSGASEVGQLAERVKQLEQQLSEVLGLNKPNGRLLSGRMAIERGIEAAEPADPTTINKTRYFGRSHWMNGVLLVSHLP
jgi:hypothetical protein